MEVERLISTATPGKVLLVRSFDLGQGWSGVRMYYDAVTVSLTYAQAAALEANLRTMLESLRDQEVRYPSEDLSDRGRYDPTNGKEGGG